MVGPDQTPPVSKNPGESEDVELRRFAIGVILFLATCVTLMAELVLALAGVSLKATAIAAVGVFGGTFGLGYFIAKRLGYIERARKTR